MTDGPAGKPLAMYRQVAADLDREIGEGRYGSGGRLPAEGELAERYGVSRGTVRQAMALLRTEGLIASRRGTRRVVIGTPKPQSFGELLSFTRWARSTGEEPGGRIVAAETRLADATERERLRLPAGAEIHAVRRLRTLSGRPVMVERTVYPSAVGELITGLPPDTVSHTVVLEESGVLFADAQHTIDLCLADAEDARLLGCRPGDPLLRERRRSTDPAGTPIEWSEDRYLPETVAFTVHSSATSGSLARRSADEA
ncbi:GntR family transcriptional regulator [Streptomyces sp. 3213]|uniref:GntR family transcriptional regulator n=1 Tax=Streptomyces sp. 3213.3 TaxID=1855348 RepID=UPI0008990DFD|nr:GntR family transcriptional regulator [Streptomyces sp. 3213.3]SEC58928.1 GntR family transcriptional regulator [Streptomyces sp. 3213] [Streptomyces sp. 3213.3]